MITPWWCALRLRTEVTDNAGNIDDVQMSLYRALHGTPAAPYADPEYYGAITHPTATLAALLGRVAVRLHGGASYTSVRALYHLDQGMGGGKSHGLVGLYQLAVHPARFAQTDIGKATLNWARIQLGGSTPPLGPTRLVALCADHMTPFAPDDSEDRDGPARTLWERFLWQLVGREYSSFVRFKDRWDQQGIVEALVSVGGPVLILVDEIMDYVRQLDDVRYADRKQAELAFLKALLDAVNDVPRVAMVLVMIASERDLGVYEAFARAAREEILGNLVRNGSNTAVSEASDFSQIIRRRLFEPAETREAVGALAAQFAAMPAAWKALLERAGQDLATFPDDLARSYPFHPSLLRLVEQEWSLVSGFQKVRSTVTLFAQTAYTWSSRAQAGEWAPALIGLGDLPLEVGAVREALLGSGVVESETTLANLRQVVATDIAGEGGAGGMATALDQRHDRDGWARDNPRAARRMATTLLLYSLTTRPGGRIGATQAEVMAAAATPGGQFALTDAETIFNALSDQETGLGSLERLAGGGGQAQRYQLSTRQTLQMLYRVQRAAVSEADRDDEMARVADAGTQRGPGFSKDVFLRDEPDAQGRPKTDSELFRDLDEQGQTRLVVLDPRRFTLLNGRDDETRRACRSALGVGPDAFPVSNAASLVLSCVNTQRRGIARARAADYLAWMRVAGIGVVADDPTLKGQADEQVAKARALVQREVRAAYQHYVYLVRDSAGDLEARFDKCEEDGASALSGAQVWDRLVAAGRAVRPGGLTAEGLVLAVQDYLPCSLAELNRLFWTNPRCPLVSGPAEVRAALFAACNTGLGALGGRPALLELVDNEGRGRPVPERPADVPMHSTLVGARLCVLEEVPEPGGGGTEGGGSHASGGEDAGPSGDEGGDERRPGQGERGAARAQVWLKAQGDLGQEERRAYMISLLRRLAAIADDGDMDTMVLTIEVTGDAGKLGKAVEIADRIEGTTHRVEVLPG